MIKKDEELVQYFVVNSELGMSAGKIAAQVAHVATQTAVHYLTMEPDNKDFWEWYSIDRQKKIILKGKQKDVERLAENFFYVLDDGWTEVPESSLTVAGLPPMKRSDAQQYIKRLQLYKD
jgi:peptidyl-tRNA hydrolase, PTH2 family